MNTHTDTLVVGAGQAGLALSFHLTQAGVEHTVLERGRLGQRWRDRWDSLTLLSPNWMNELPGGAAHADREGFLDRLAFIDYLESYARSFAAPVREGVDVIGVERGAAGFHVVTSAGRWHARNVVVATGDADAPHVPLEAPPGVHSLHAVDYRRPELLPDGPVLVVGAGATGQQLALELRAAGREVVLSVGRHSRAPRIYRGRDIFEWLHLLGDFDRTVGELSDLEAAKRVPLFPLSGGVGNAGLGLELLDERGISIRGRLTRFEGTRAMFADDLAQNLAKSDERVSRLLARIDAHPLARGTEAPDFRAIEPAAGPGELDVGAFGAILWATGYRRSYPWLRVPVLDTVGEIVHTRGVTRVPGLYVLGLAYLYRRSSHFIGGVGADAAFLADMIAVGSAAAARAA